MHLMKQDLSGRAPASTVAERPHRSLVARAYDRASRRDTLSADALLEMAERRSRLDDWGDQDFQSGLRCLVADVNLDPRITPFGVICWRSRLLDMLAQRLRIQSWLREHPGI